MKNMVEVETPETDQRSTSARITVIVQQRHVVDTGSRTGRQIKELAGIPADFMLYRKAKGGNEPVTDDDPVDIRNGDHFFARPSG